MTKAKEFIKIMEKDTARDVEKRINKSLAAIRKTPKVSVGSLRKEIKALKLELGSIEDQIDGMEDNQERDDLKFSFKQLKDIISQKEMEWIELRMRG